MSGKSFSESEFDSDSNGGSLVAKRCFGPELWLGEKLARRVKSKKMSGKSFSESEFDADSNGGSLVASRCF
ncbi:Hypothetical predicted protein, partial [Paramuricea clavata]